MIRRMPPRRSGSSGRSEKVETIASGISVRDRHGLSAHHVRGRWRKAKGRSLMALRDGTVALAGYTATLMGSGGER